MANTVDSSSDRNGGLSTKIMLAGIEATLIGIALGGVGYPVVGGYPMVLLGIVLTLVGLASG